MILLVLMMSFTVASSASCSRVGSTPYLGSVAPQKLLVWPRGFFTPDILERGAEGVSPLHLLPPATSSSSSRRLLISTSCCLSIIIIIVSTLAALKVDISNRYHIILYIKYITYYHYNYIMSDLRHLTILYLFYYLTLDGIIPFQAFYCKYPAEQE